MTTEEKLKAYILERYKSIREFTIEIDMPYSTLDSVFKRGIDNSSLGVILKVCNALNISADALGKGEIIQKPLDYSVVINGVPVDIEVKEVDQILENAKRRLLSYTDLMLEGKPVKKEEITNLVNGIDISLEMVKKNQS